MIKFIVVEDDKKSNVTIVNIIEKTIFKTNIDYLIETYFGYNQNLQKTIEDCSMQKVYILDIDLGKSISGLEIAKEIRKKDWDSEIIFVTSHDKMFETIYRNVFKVFDFIEKFISLDSRLEDDLKLIISQKADYKKFCFMSNKINIQIYLKDITHIYRETSERKLVIKTTNNKFLLNRNINDILKDLDSRFKQVHRACIVNTERVNLFNWTKGYLILDNNEKVDMCSKAFKEKL